MFAARDKPLQLRAVHLQLPLIVPYRLAFGEQRQFDVILVGVRDRDGRSGWGEATILPGYTTETIEGGWLTAQYILSHCNTSQEVWRAAQLAAKDSPFIATAFLTALDWLEAHPFLSRAGRFPLLGTVNGKSEQRAALAAEIEALLATGYKTLKVKIGWDVAKDLEQVNTVRAIAAGRAQLRVDGNQGYSRDQAVTFLSQLDPAGIELVEQPCAAGDWDAAVAVKRAANVPIMLDEGIYTLDDIERAASLGCADYIKLKLMKLGSLDKLAYGLQMIADEGMKAVLGNGVAADLGCWMEIATALGTVTTAGEMNGFLKTRPQLLLPPLRMEGADVVLDGKLPDINETTLRDYAVGHAGGWS
ncbi:MAG: mandelate racemase [Acidocella sp. 20-57-95]|nr:MAG: mandelate racemase [Acidocella sp. 20-57-95]OYV62676.1 MAG: mandelate racemase [Acidocella sp. 21-58-7]HQT63146.1 enolase C-terminal domain-like protein [Acidocella sp.]HQU03334.1 enolase C-terminal domain-like protein [Acidocella sp.]